MYKALTALLVSLAVTATAPAQITGPTAVTMRPGVNGSITVTTANLSAVRYDVVGTFLRNGSRLGATEKDDTKDQVSFDSAETGTYRVKIFAPADSAGSEVYIVVAGAKADGTLYPLYKCAVIVSGPAPVPVPPGPVPPTPPVPPAPVDPLTASIIAAATTDGTSKTDLKLMASIVDTMEYQVAAGAKAGRTHDLLLVTVRRSPAFGPAMKKLLDGQFAAILAPLKSAVPDDVIDQPTADAAKKAFAALEAALLEAAK